MGHFEVQDSFLASGIVWTTLGLFNLIDLVEVPLKQSGPDAFFIKSPLTICFFYGNWFVWNFLSTDVNFGSLHFSKKVII